MKKNIGTEERIFRSLVGSALIVIGFTWLRRRKGRTAGLDPAVLGAILTGTAITKFCPLNALLGIDTRRKRHPFTRVYQALGGIIFSSHRQDLLAMEGEAIKGKKPAEPQRVTNFGKNVRFSPMHFYTPKNESEILAILNMHSKYKIRAIGSLHAWSEVAASDDVTIDMRHFAQVQVERKEDEVWATVGAGCRLEDLIHTLHKQAGVTLPTVPAVTEQTIAGTISTATHGSGMPSMSHFIEEARVAAYDSQTGEARIYDWSEGPELRAARCGVGCTGVILSVRFRCVPSYSIEQSVARVSTIDEALASESEYPLQQTILIPYAWEYFVYQRRPIHDKQVSTSWMAYLFRAHWFVVVDVLFHTTLLPLVNVVGSRRLIRWFLRDVTPLMLWAAPPHTDDSAEVLVLEHELFSHLEMELFVPARHIREAVKLLTKVMSLFAGDIKRVPPQWEDQLESIGMLEELYRNRDTYFHHYPILVRRIMPDDTLISMTSESEEPYYSISVFTYYRDRSKIYPMANFLAFSMNRLYGAGLHWGKHFPLNNAEIEPLYPRLKEFRELCTRVDPNGVFRNSFTRRVLGFGEY
ncbi:DUF2892 domain-containing protein [Pontibacter diazotrophicus]|uniref:DUF2892 domain-containing protein n=1 Tax=Pontibacter diazotrophicus TaxID=1400979 RepID=A0A3D8L7L7_9BACT|nr:D-arabinono-1,4-lactone oxidase [Pontibacter diazotrophicus]RDV12972.1 DUF2892 domain-containing protein [Pontibacter diazotrophicus]